MRIVIIGAGAAGCFAAIEVKRRCPEAEVTVLEKGTRPLAKVAITGGGRCNLTNSFAEVKSLEQVYPRGFRLMKKLFHHFSPQNAYEWFEREGIRLVTQDDECVFPQSQDAMEIVNKLISLMERLKVRVVCGCKVEEIKALPTGFELSIINSQLSIGKVLSSAFSRAWNRPRLHYIPHPRPEMFRSFYFPSPILSICRSIFLQ